jgi:hypothetical protein
MYHLGLLTHYTHKLRCRIPTPKSPNSVYRFHKSHTHTHTHTHTGHQQQRFLGEELKLSVFEHRPPRRAAVYSRTVRSANRPVYWGDQIEDQTDGASGKYVNKKIFIKGLGSKNSKERDYV